MRSRALPVLGVVLLVTGLIGLVLTWAYVQESAPIGSTSGPTGGLRRGGVDAMFIEEMIPHHDDAIEMAEIAIDEAEHEELRELARDIRETQTRENEQMREWYREWYDTGVPEGGRGMMGRGGMMGGDVDMEEFARSEPFDKAFIEEMIPHHQTAIMMANMLLIRSNRPEMRALAEDIIETQSEEIEQMREWYREWYGD